MRRLTGLAVLALLAGSCVFDSNPPETVPEIIPPTTATTSTAAVSSTTTVSTIPAWEPDPDFTLNVGVFHDVPPNNPWSPSYWSDTYYGQPTDISLYRLLPPGYTLAPMLAAPAEPPLPVQNGDSWVVEIPLREGILWSDGEPVTEFDAWFTFDTFRKLEHQREYGDPNLLSIEAAPSGGVQITWNERPTMDSYQYGVALAPVYPEHFWGRERMESLTPDEILAMDGAGAPTAGPYQMGPVSNDGSSWHLVPNPFYFEAGADFVVYENGVVQYTNERLGLHEFYGGAPGGDAVEVWTEGPFAETVAIQTVEFSSSACEGVRPDGMDLILSPIGWAGPCGQEFAATSLANSVATTGYIAFNLDRPGPSNQVVREVIECRISPMFVANQMLVGSVSSDAGYVSPGFTGWHLPPAPSCDGSEEDRFNAAFAWMEGSGFTWVAPPVYGESRGDGLELHGEPIPQMTLITATPGLDPVRGTFGLVIGQWVRELGFDVTVETLPLHDLAHRIYDAHDFDLAILQLTSDEYPAHLADAFSSGGMFNVSSYVSEEFESAWFRLASALQVDAAQQEAFEIQSILSADIPWIPLYERTTIEPHNKRVWLPVSTVLNGIQAFDGMLSAIQLAEPG